MTRPTILVTGANRGIGLELIRQFAADDWRVIACARNLDAADQLQALAAGSANVELQELDVTDYERMQSLGAELATTAIDILLSNAGIYGPKGVAFGAVDAERWREVLEVNTIAPLMLAQAFVDSVATSKRKLIAVVSSKVGSIADNSSGGSYAYRSSKSAVNQVVKSLSIDLADRGITTLSLHPGWVLTEMGGPNAEIDTRESVAGLKSILQQAGPAQNGCFIEYNGQPIPW